MKGKLLFSERQSFRNTFFWWLELTIGLSVIALMAYGISVQIFLGQPWGNNPMSDTALILTSIATIVIMGGIHWLFTTMQLIIEIDASGIHYSYYPFVSRTKHVRKKDLKSVEVRLYSPILEYGGWGYRISLRNGKSFNIKGSYGLQLIFSNGNKLLLGTQKPDELRRALKQLEDNWND